MTDVSFRPPRRDEIVDCALVWHASVDDYMARLNRPLPPPVLDPLVELLGHFLTTDPERFLVAVVPEPASTQGGGRIIAFGVALQRERVWFLSELFVLPEAQRSGIGRSLLTLLLPSLEEGAAPDGPERRPRDGVLATCTDAAQPISNGLYAGLGIVPRLPIFNLVGRPTDPASLPRLPEGVEALPLTSLVDPAAADSILGEIDRATLGYAHPADHAYLRRSGRIGYLFRTGGGEPLGYGYASPVGRFGPVAVLDETLTAPVIAHMLTSVEPRGATSAWIPGANDRAFVALLRAGLRVEGFPGLLCWTRPFGHFERYVPGGLALL